MQQASRKFAAGARCLVAAALLSALGCAWARNDALFLPIADALRDPEVQRSLDPAIELRFGSASSAGFDVSAGKAEAYLKGDLSGPPNPNAGGSRQRYTDAQSCVDAFRRAALALQARARKAGATSVVGIVSYYDRTEHDSRDTYECHVGMSRTVMGLRGHLGRKAP